MPAYQTLQAVTQALITELQTGGTVTIDDNLLGSGTAFAALVRSSLLRDAGNILLTATAANIPSNPTGSSFTFTAGLPTAAGDSFLNLAGNAATATISGSGPPFQFSLTIQLTKPYNSTGELSWVFSTSFPSLLGWPFDSVPFTGPEFVFAFAPDSQTLPQGTAQGLNFSSPFQLTGFLAVVNSLLTKLNLEPHIAPLAGAIGQSPYGPYFALEANLGVSPMNLIALSIESPHVGLSLDYVSSDSTDSTDEVYEPQALVFVGGRTTLKNSNGVAVNLDCQLQFPLKGGSSQPDVMQLAIVPSDDFSTSIANLGQLMAGQTWNQFFAEPPANVLAPYLSVFGLQSYTFRFSPSTLSIYSSVLSAGTVADGGWQINPNLIVSNFSIAWMLIEPFTQPYNSVSISATVDMFSALNQKVTFTGSILLPSLSLSLALASESNMTAAAWLQTIIAAFGGPTDSLPSYIASALDAFTLNTMVFSMDVPAEKLAYQLSGGFLVGGYAVDFNLFIDLTLGSKYDIAVSFVFGNVSANGEIAYDQTAGKTQITAHWDDETNPLGLETIAIALGYDLLGIPPDLDMGLKQIDVTYDLTDSVFAVGADSANYGAADVIVFRPDETSWGLFAGLTVDRPIDLTNLPLVGQTLSFLESVQIRDLTVLITSTALSEDQAGQLNNIVAQLDGPYPTIPNEGMASTVNLSMVLDIGGFIVPFGSGIGGDSTTDLPAEQSSVQGTPQGDQTASVPTTAGAQSDGTSWFNIQKSLGPVTFKRIGVRYADSVLWFVLDATLSAGGLVIDLVGAGVGSPLTTFDPQFTLSGLGVTFEEPGFEIAGALLSIPPGPGIDWEFAGGIVLRLANFSLSAVGSYASMSGTPSMFLFGQVTGAFGGPPAFFVTGFAAGFGYNTSLRVPDINEVSKFPLVAGLQNPQAMGGSSPTPTQVLSTLFGLDGKPAWIAPSAGTYWFAAGIQFTSYELVFGNVMAIAEFGKSLQFAMLGLAQARFPMAGSFMFANLAVQIETSVDLSQAYFSVSAVLTDTCFLLDPACRLTGGIVARAWFPPSDHAGDFVLAIGGYHPTFQRPSWYPDPGKVSISWSVGGILGVTGSGYFAMTPSAIMAGASLNAHYGFAGIDVSFSAQANMMMFWNPLHFDADIGIQAKASYTQDLGVTTETISAEVSATLHLWGPPTGGSVFIDLYVTSFTVTFGASATTNPPPLTWGDFQKLLPPPADIVKVTPGDGLSPNGSSDLSSAPWRVRPSGFSFTTMSSIPSSSLQLAFDGFQVAQGQQINIRPMQQTGFVSIQTLGVTMDNEAVDLRGTGWTVAAVLQNVPKAMWGTMNTIKTPFGTITTMPVDAGDQQLVPNQPMGFSIQSPPPAVGSSPGPVFEENFAYDRLSPAGTLAVQPGQTPQGPVAQTSTGSVLLIGQEIAATSYAQTRTSLFQALQALGVNPLTNGDMSAFANKVGGLFAAEPLVIPR